MLIINYYFLRIICIQNNSRTKFVGTGLGAAIAGIVGRYISFKTKQLLPRITGLAPDSRHSGITDLMCAVEMLRPGDAKFVDVIYAQYCNFIFFLYKHQYSDIVKPILYRGV